MKNIIPFLLIIVPSICSATDSTLIDSCFQKASATYRIDKSILIAIAKVESNLNPRAINQNINGSYDYGIMQINDQWLPKLASYGIGRHNIYEPCVNIHVGAYILATNFASNGINWQSVAMYNVGKPKSQALIERGRSYVKKVQSKLKQGERP